MVFFPLQVERHEKDATRALFLALRVCLLELFSPGARCYILINQLRGNRDNASLVLFLFFWPFVSQRSVRIAVFFKIRRLESFLILV